MKPMRIAILASILMLSACYKQADKPNTDIATIKPFGYHLICFKNNDSVLFEDDVYMAYPTQAGSGVRYKKHESDDDIVITNAICVITPLK